MRTDLRNSKLLRSERREFSVVFSMKKPRNKNQTTKKTINGKRVLGLALCHIGNVHYQQGSFSKEDWRGTFQSDFHVFFRLDSRGSVVLVDKNVCHKGIGDVI